MFAVAVLLRSCGSLMSSAADATHRLTPISLTRADKGKWEPVAVVGGIVNIKGGYNRSGKRGSSISYQVDNTIHVFVELDKNAEWFLKGVGGTKIQKGELKAVRALQMIRELFQKKLETEPDAAAAVDQEQLSAVAGSQSESREQDGDFDPMDQMDDLEAVAPLSKKVKPPKTEPPKSVVQELEVPTKPQCTGCDRNGKTVVFVYRSSDKRSNGSYYLRMDCLGWLLAYAADELAFQGIDQAIPEPTPNPAGNCSEVVDLRVEWDFDAKAWDATFVAGALVGTTRRMSISDLDRHVWDRLRQQSPTQMVTFRNASQLGKKQGLREFMVLWCGAIARGEAAAREFNALWCAANASSPQRGEKRVLEDTPADDTAVAVLFSDDDAAVADLFMDSGSELDE